jgi:hypothetical protein
VHLLYPFGAQSFQPGEFGGQVVGVDVQVHPARAVAEPLDEQPDFLAVEDGAMVFGVSVKPGQRLADRCAPKRQFAAVLGRRDINHDLGQPAVVSHPVNLRGLAAGQTWRHSPDGISALERRTSASLCISLSEPSGGEPHVREYGLLESDAARPQATAFGVNGPLTLTNDEAYDLVIDVAAGHLDSVTDVAARLRTATESRS